VNIQAAFIALAGYFGTGETVTGAPQSLRPVPATLEAWPNPARGEVHLVWSGAPVGSAIEVYNVAGRRVWSAPATASGSATWEMSGRTALAPGLYLARLAGTSAKAIRFVALP